MKLSIRFVVLAAAAFAALAFAGSALAAYKPIMFINQSTYQPSAAADVEIVISVPADQDATAKAVIIAPSTYQANLTAAAGTTIGSVSARVKANDLAGAILKLSGTVVVGTLTDATTAAAATQCTGTPSHTTVWILNATLQGQTLRIPVFVDAVTGGFTRLSVCFGSPYAAAGPAKAPFGAQLVLADFVVKGIFTNPAKSLVFWDSIFTPWVVNTATPNAAGTVEVRGVVPIPFKITLRAVKTRKGSVRLGGTVSSFLSLIGEKLDLYVGTKANNMKFSGHTGKVSKKNKYSFTRSRSKKAGFVQTGFGPADVTSAGCQNPLPPTLAPGGCVSATLSPTYSNIVKVPARKKK